MLKLALFISFVCVKPRRVFLNTSHQRSSEFPAPGLNLIPFGHMMSALPARHDPSCQNTHNQLSDAFSALQESEEVCPVTEVYTQKLNSASPKGAPELKLCSVASDQISYPPDLTIVQEFCKAKIEKEVVCASMSILKGKVQTKTQPNKSYVIKTRQKSIGLARSYT